MVCLLPVSIPSLRISVHLFCGSHQLLQLLLCVQQLLHFWITNKLIYPFAFGCVSCFSFVCSASFQLPTVFSSGVSFRNGFKRFNFNFYITKHYFFNVCTHEDGITSHCFCFPIRLLYHQVCRNFVYIDLASFWCVKPEFSAFWS